MPDLYDTAAALLPRARPAMRGRYLIRKAPQAAAVGLMDALLRLVPVRRNRPVPKVPQRILVANWGHMGDVVTCFGALAALRRRYPGARIGMIVGSWGRAAAQSSGLVDDIHVFNHWALNRAPLSRAEKKAQFRTTRDAALKQIKAVGYDVALDLYPYFPPAHPLFYKAGIAVRIGFNSGGFGPLLTHAVPWRNESRPISDYYRDILNILMPGSLLMPGDLAPSAAMIPRPGRPALLPAQGPYIVLHPGTGAASRGWALGNWLTLTNLLVSRGVADGFTLVLTGAGERDIAGAAQIAAHFPQIVNLAGRVAWTEFVGVIGNAALVICPDTVTGHLAALFDVPTVTISTGTVDPVQWGPTNPHARMLVHSTPCAPCNRPGCAAMACIANVTPLQVLEASQALLQGA